MNIFQPKILDKRRSKYNGEIIVTKDLAFGVTVRVGGLTQSGGIVEEIWRKTLRKVKSKKSEVKNCLILGLGGGSSAKVIRKFWPDATITGIDIDPIMIEMGNKYLGLDKLNVRIQVCDAFKFMTSKGQSRISKFDLILIDLYVGFEFPSEFEEEIFLKAIARNLSTYGVAVFNRLYSGDKRPAAVKFGQKLEKVFSKVEYYYPQANLMFICRSLN